MDIEFLKKINFLFSSPKQQINVSLFLVLRLNRVSDTVDVRQLSIGNELAEELKKIANDTLSQIEIYVNEKTLAIFNPDLEQENFIMAAKEIPDFETIEQILIQSNPPQYLSTKTKEETMKAWAICFEFEFEGKTLHLFLFQRFSPARMLKRNVINFFEHDGRFEVVKNNFLTLNKKIDSLIIDDQLVVLDRKAFEHIFRFERVYEQGGQRILDVLEKGRLSKDVAIENVQLLRKEFLKSSRSVRKLYRIGRSGFFKKIKLVELKKLNKRYDLHLEFSNNKWIITEQTDPDVMLNILNDEYNRSLITNNEYRSETKEKLN